MHKMKLTIFTFACIAGTVVSAGGGLALRAESCPAAASKICGSATGDLKDCCPEDTTCTVVGRKTYCCSSGRFSSSIAYALWRGVFTRLTGC